MNDATLAWWTLLRGVAAVNLVVWVAAALLLVRRRGAAPERTSGRHWQLLLSAGYVLGCGYRCLLPVFDVQRLVLVDSWWSSVIVGRSVATIAELCFAAQWALLLAEASRATGCRTAQRAARVLVPLIVVAETFSWTAVLTTANIGHVVEESLWGVAAALVVAGVVAMRTRVAPVQRPLLWACAAAGVVYAVYMFGVDVPMYWSRWIADQAQGRAYLGIAEGALDASTRWVVSHRWDDWKSEVVWMSLYFSVAVWLSIGLVHAPRLLLRTNRS